MKKALISILALGIFLCAPIDAEASELIEVGQYGRPFLLYDSEEQIAEEKRLGDMELISQLVEAEAGNQDLRVKRLVACVILNRLESDEFPDTVEEVIFQKKQFSVTKDGAWEKAAYNMKETDYKAVELEYESQSNDDFLYFNNSSNVSGSGTPVKIGDLWFNTK